MSRAKSSGLNADELVSSRYLIERPIGRGGMQDVYLARDMLLDACVALKTPLPGQVDKRFEKSAQISARVNHHNVAKTLDYVDDGERLFLVEEYVEGEDLGRALDRFCVLDPHLGVKVFLRLAKGIAASHHAGVVHCDLKPSNVIVGEGFDVLKITDFGVASLAEEVFVEERRRGDITRSASGTVKGALPYMAPELMFNNDGVRPERPSDIWSLGAMMFQVLAGFCPFGVYLDAAVNVKMQTRKPWPEFMLNKPQYKAISRELQSLVEECLEYDADNRPTADMLVSKLSDLCFVGSVRKYGVVDKLKSNGYSGLIIGDDGSEVFFSKESVYGPDGASIGPGSRVCYSCFPGEPNERAHPVILIKK